MSLAATAVFVVEDEPIIQQPLQVAFEDDGFAVVIACSGETAIAMLEAQSPEFQVLVTDVNFAPAKLTGWDVAKRARELSPNLPVVYITGGAAHGWRGMGVPNSVLLLKPFALTRLLTAVSQLLNMRSQVNPSWGGM